MTRRKTNGNRTDLLSTAQPVRVATGQPYGSAQASAQAQTAVPLPNAQQPPVSPDLVAQQLAQQTPPPEAPIHAPSQRPHEPLTAGLPMGPGAGPEVLARGPGMEASLVGTLRGLYQTNPNSDLAALIAELDMRSESAGPGQMPGTIAPPQVRPSQGV
jgi:hypothetical protein